MTFLVPMFAGAFTIGMALTKAIQVSNVARDAVVLMVRSNSDPESGLDLVSNPEPKDHCERRLGAGHEFGRSGRSQCQRQRCGDSVPSGDGGSYRVFARDHARADRAPPWNASNCPNFGSYVFEYRVVIGNGTRWTSTLGNPGGPVESNGTISAADIASNSSDRAANFNTVTGMTLSASTFALVSEMYADVSYLNFFSVMSNPVIYARSIS